MYKRTFTNLLFVLFLQAVLVGQGVDRESLSKSELVCTLSKKLSKTERLAALRSMDSVSQSDIDVFYKFLRDGIKPPGITSTWHYYLQNEVLGKLFELPSPPKGIASLITEISLNESQAITLREYAHQYMSLYYAKVSAQDKELIVSGLKKMMNETGTNLAGSALTALKYIEIRNPGVSVLHDSRDLVLKTALNQDAKLESRLPAIELAAQLLGNQFYNDAIALAKNEANAMQVRIVAVAALGAIGNPDVVTWLEGIDKKSRLYIPAQAAMKKISEQ